MKPANPFRGPLTQVGMKHSMVRVRRPRLMIIMHQCAQDAAVSHWFSQRKAERGCMLIAHSIRLYQIVLVGTNETTSLGTIHDTQRSSDRASNWTIPPISMRTPASHQRSAALMQLPSHHIPVPT